MMPLTSSLAVLPGCSTTRSSRSSCLVSRQGHALRGKAVQSPFSARTQPVRRQTAVAGLSFSENGMPSVTDIPSLDPEVGQPLIYTVLGLSALSFVGTFFLAPKFKDQLKEGDDWKTIYNTLMETGGVKTITAEQAKAKRGAVILDVRLERKTTSGMADGSINIPLYQPIQGWDLASSVRRAAFAFFGIFGTERNPDFLDDVLSKIPKNKEVVILCEMGGSMENKSGTKTGFQSRSLKALHYLRQAGYSKLYHMEEGIGGWQRAGFRMTLPDEA